MKLLLCSAPNIGSWFLRFVMWSRWSHSAILDEDLGLVYDTTLLQGGVKVTPFLEWCKKYPAVEIRDLDCRNVAEARAWLQKQLGKGYDWTAIFAFPFQRDWQKDDKWFCSEFSETFRTLFCNPVFRADAGRITPHHQDIVI